MDRQKPVFATLVGALLLIAGTMAAYFPAMYGEFLWDDGLYIAENQTIQAPDGLRHIWLDPNSSPNYYPMWIHQKTERNQASK